MHMSDKFRFPNRNQPYLLPISIEDWVQEDHLARFVVEVTEELDIRAIRDKYRGNGIQAYDPRMLLALLFYGYATGTFSSRKIEQATYDSVAFRYISANEHPDHDTIATFRKRFLPQLSGLFIQILQIAHESKFLKLGTISLDGTKIKANASKHQALSHEHASKIEEALEKEVAELFRMAEESDNEPAPEGMNIPEEISRREDRLAVIRAAKKEIARRAEERRKIEDAEYQEKLAARKKREDETGKKTGGKKPKPPQEGPRQKDQVNLTDADSRIMPQSGGGFDQSYNAQAGVDEESLLIVGAHVTQKPNDNHELEPMLRELESLPEELGKADKLLADAGYYSEENVKKCAEHNIEPYISMRRERHYQGLRERFEDPETTVSENVVDQMKSRLASLAGRAIYARRKCTVEPVFGIIKAVIGFRQFLLRGIESVQGEWNLVCMAWNLKRLHKLKVTGF